MKSIYKNDKGFSLTELMFAMTILAVGLLALASMQLMAMRGTSSSRDFNTATNLARDAIEQMKLTRLFIVQGNNVQVMDILGDETNTNNSEATHAPDIDKDTAITDIKHDRVEVLRKSPDTDLYESICGPLPSPANCNGSLGGDWDFVRIYNVRNIPDNVDDGDAIMKDVNVIVIWQEELRTRSVSLRTIIARKDDDFF